MELSGVNGTRFCDNDGRIWQVVKFCLLNSQLGSVTEAINFIINLLIFYKLVTVRFGTKLQSKQFDRVKYEWKNRL